MSLLLVTAFTTADWHRAELLFDWHRKLHNQMPCGHVLLVATNDVHGELRAKLRIAADLAFESVQEIQTKQAPTGIPSKDHVFSETALHIGRSYRWPWLWLEPDCVPLRSDWIQSLFTAYEQQPSRYCGPHLKVGEGLSLARVSIYPASAINDLNAKRDLLPMSTKSRLIQYGGFLEGDTLTKVREDAVLFHSCKSKALVEALDAQPRNGQKLIGSKEDFAQVRRAVTPKKVSK